WMRFARLFARRACTASSSSASLSSTSSISTSFVPTLHLFLCDFSGLFLILRARQSKEESSAFVDLAFGPGAATVLMDDALDRRQADTRPLKVCLAMQPLEYSKELVHMFHAETDAVIANEDSRLAVHYHLSHLDDSDVPGAREL